MSEVYKRERLLDIDRAKGLAIILVVLGHLSDTAPKGNEWYDALKLTLYSFHMAFFMFLSGYVMYISYHPVDSFTSAAKYIVKSFKRLMIPFLFFVFLIFVGKYVAQSLMLVNNPVNSLNDFLKVLLYPTDSIVRNLWYIYVLFIFYILFPLLMISSHGRIEYWLVVGVVLSLYRNFIDVSHFMALQQLCAYFIFLLLGASAAKTKDQYLSHIDKWGWAWFCLFGISLMIYHFTYIPLLITGILSIPALHSLVRKNPLMKSNVLLTLGTFVFSIYLMNTIFIGLMRGLILKFVSFGYWHFFIIAPVLVVVGLAGPIIVYRVIGQRSNVLSMLLGGPSLRLKA